MITKQFIANISCETEEEYQRVLDEASASDWVIVHADPVNFTVEAHFTAVTD